MKTKIFSKLCLIIVYTLVVGFSLPADGNTKIALAIKVIRDVSKRSENVDWSLAKKGDLLYSGDQVRTGERSIAIVKFMDNSMLRVREKSELKIFGEQKEGKFSRTINLIRGEFTFDIKKQEDEQFTLTSPTSVAAIRGTDGTLTTSNEGDFITVLDGLVNFLNTLSNSSVEVGAGQTGISSPDGSIEVRDATPGEIEAARKALNATRGTGNEREVMIQLQDETGKKKEIRIRYRE